MRIQPVDHPGQLNRAMKLARDTRAPLTATGDPLARPTIESVDAQPIAGSLDGVINAAPVDPAPQGEGKVRGVIRNLEAGHFKGVADVRLRINFFDELSERAAVASAYALTQEADGLVATMSTKVDDLVQEFGGAEENTEVAGFVEQFGLDVQGAVEAGTSDGSLDLDAFTEQLQSSFEALAGQLATLLDPETDATDATNTGDASATLVDGATRILPVGVLAQPLNLEAVTAVSADGATGAATAVEPSLDLVPIDTANPEDQPAAAPIDDMSDEPESPTTTFENALASFREAFDDALSTLIESVETASALPAPSESTGNGSAYDKFLAIYNDLSGITATVDQRA